MARYSRPRLSDLSPTRAEVISRASAASGRGARSSTATIPRRPRPAAPQAVGISRTSSRRSRRRATSTASWSSSSKHFGEAERRPGVAGANLLRVLESRLDNVVYRLGFADSRKQASSAGPSRPLLAQWSANEHPPPPSSRRATRSPSCRRAVSRSTSRLSRRASRARVCRSGWNWTWRT